MIHVENYGHILGQDHRFQHLAEVHGGGRVRLIPEISANKAELIDTEIATRSGKKTVQDYPLSRPFRVDGTEINTRTNLRRMRMAESFGNVDKDEHRVAVLSGDNGTPRQKILVSKQLADFTAADEVYESEKARVHLALAGLKAEELDEVAAYSGHAWSASGLKVSDKRAELIDAEAV